MLLAFDYVGEVKTVKAVIVQPRLDHISECTYTVDELKTFLDEIGTCAKAAKAEIELGGDALHLCPGRAHPAPWRTPLCRDCPHGQAR